MAIDIRAILVDEARLRRAKANIVKMAFPTRLSVYFSTFSERSTKARLRCWHRPQTRSRKRNFDEIST